jgi:hypothetical protein
MSLPDGRKVIALDFDGVLHDYHGWNHGMLKDEIPGMILLVDTLVAEGAYRRGIHHAQRGGGQAVAPRSRVPGAGSTE